MTASLIALDWGTSNLRAKLLDASGRVLEARSTPGGVMAVRDGRFAEALLALVGDWLQQHNCPLIASGMIGSRQGWREAPYLPCPASLDQAAAALTRIDLPGGHVLTIVPGLRCEGDDGVADVMRGEETQLWGAGLPTGSCCVLPGTHAKWAWVGEGGRIESFQTFMTGELYGLLTQHGILGRLMEFGHADPQAFRAGVRLGLAEHASASHVIFAARTAGLMGTIAPRGLPDYLSGILVGIEIAGATKRGRPQTVTVLGDEALAARYESALQVAGIACRLAPEDATTQGQWLVAQRARLLR
ncbi:2-dehydro-3-deoxygalactonokinase [Ramlibacter sp. G-1-2-2]|uniref:2-dehydro-3-deoxygalactonokinase n=1 Tax=Ramlibacter agri TaxID=2728837 RepID=A0A848HCL7_9BURK|nr:2-dehydro-3-deoxygalactonokinase [Ramlibacter agri]NML47229.1 2-dehydro-3-deoxygalactonokinase [Ramlibacter agri]